MITTQKKVQPTKKEGMTTNEKTGMYLILFFILIVAIIVGNISYQKGYANGYEDHSTFNKPVSHQQKGVLKETGNQTATQNNQQLMEENQWQYKK